MIDTPAQIAADFRRRMAPTPTDEALAEVADYLRRKHLVAIDKNKLGFALSTIEMGLRDLLNGKDRGGAAIRDGVEYIRRQMEGAQS